MPEAHLEGQVGMEPGAEVSTEPDSTNSLPTPIESPLSMRDLAILLVKHYGLHEGRYDLTVEFQIGVGGVGSDVTNLSPGATFAVKKVGLVPTQAFGGASVDAGEVNPTTKGPKKKVSS